MNPLIVTLPGNEQFGLSLASALGTEATALEIHRFPDAETLVRFREDVNARDVILVCTLDRPDAKFLPLLFATETARDLGASGVGLVAPYLCYMRQDTRFRQGEAVSAKVFAEAVSKAVDWVVTVDPHLHRISSLSEIFSVPARAVHADAEIAAWITREVLHPLLVGPDTESAQWIESVARRIGCPTLLLQKQRRGDCDVKISAPNPKELAAHTPVILDDIISSGQTMRETVLSIRRLCAGVPVCFGVHAVFADEAFQDLVATGARIVTANTIKHSTNQIDLAPAVAQVLRKSWLNV